jgi:hypothetical protein
VRGITVFFDEQKGTKGVQGKVFGLLKEMGIAGTGVARATRASKRGHGDVEQQEEATLLLTNEPSSFPQASKETCGADRQVRWRGAVRQPAGSSSRPRRAGTWWGDTRHGIRTLLFFSIS